MIMYPGRSQVLMPNSGIEISRPRGNSALYNSLVAYWKLDEASGDRADSVGANTLTDTNTVLSATGKAYALAGDFESGNTEYLQCADDTVVSTGDIQFWFAGWFNLESSPTASGVDILGKWDQVASNQEYLLELYRASSQNHFRWAVSSNGTAVTGDLDNIESIVNSTWYFFCVWHDSVANQTGYRVGTQVRTLSYSTGVRDGTSQFSIGRGVTARYFDGLIGPVMMGKGYIPSTADLDFMYNNNNSRTLEAMKAY